MKIAMIGQRGVPATYGGVERHVEEIGARLAAKGHEVVVFNRREYANPDDDVYRGIHLRVAGTVNTKHFEAISHSAASTFAALREDFDVLHYHAVGPGLLTVVPRGKPQRPTIVQTIHGLDAERPKWGKVATAFLRTGQWLSARVPDATVVVSQSLRAHYRERYKRETIYIPNGVNEPVTLPPNLITEKYGLLGDDYALFVGRFVPSKAPHLLLEAFASLPVDTKLVMAGDTSNTDSYVEQLHSMAADDPRVIFTGYVYGDTLTELYSNTAAFVLPSELEGLPLTLLEAVSHGAPIIVSDIGPHVEVLRHSAPGRRLFPCNDLAALVESLGKALRNVDEERIGAAELRAEVLDRYSWQKAADTLEQTYADAIALRHSRGQQ